jgi:transketolase
MEQKLNKTQELARKIRIHSLIMANRAGTSHIGSCLSCADILAVLYGSVMKYKSDNPKWEGRDRFILSKGHAGSALYATLAECGFFPVEMLDTHCQSGSILLGHVSHLVPGVEASTGSLGHGLSIGCGMAMALRNSGNGKSRVFVLLSDGDLNEGSTWEAVMFAGQHKLSSLTAIVDYNRIQCTGESAGIIDLGKLADRWGPFGWSVRDINGHSHQQLELALAIQRKTMPTCIVARTVKGKGVSFMQGRVEWHFKSPSDEELEKSLEELQCTL